jgi:hypothetical protein
VLDLNATKDVATRWMLCAWQNQRMDGEVWLVVVRADRDLALILDNELKPSDQVYGELESEVVGDRFVYHVIPYKQRANAETKQLQILTKAHKLYRASLYKAYSIKERIRDLG